MKFKLSSNSIEKVGKPSFFSADQCEALFKALLLHDEINLDVSLPKPRPESYTQVQLNEYFQLSHQLWRDGLSRLMLLEMIEKIYHQGKLDADDKHKFYCMRAKIKHLRYAFLMFDRNHRFPMIFHWMAAVMGYMQDLLKSSQHSSVKRVALLVKLFLTKPIYALVIKKFDKFIPSSSENFHQYLDNSIDFINSKLIKDRLTSHEFHEVRRVISRIVTFYNCIYILYPDNYQYVVLLYLRTINGLMGSVHDDLIVASFNKTQNYHKDTFEMPTVIKQRLMAYVEFYKNQANLS
jgi:hypothetical protein